MTLRPAILLLAALALARPAGAFEVTRGGTTEYSVGLTPALRELAGAGGHSGKPAPVRNALCAVAVPADFDPAKPWPVLVVSSTSDARYNSSRRLMARFTAPALAAGWVVVAADPDRPAAEGDDTNGLRYALIKAALAGLQLQWPGFPQWPVAFGGFSGGAKRSAWMAAMFTLDGHQPVGVFQGGCNEDAMADALTTYRPDQRAFRNIPVFLSSGDQDPIATPEQQRDVSLDLTQQGFRHVRLERYAGRHEVNAAHITAALQWFTQLAAAPAKKP